ncbi:potassium channel AKT1-like isoform X2 [Chenopodium quinoa]|nr:potassium channel AKT1-like isoform X2 [Chenopodium quinoa]
MFNYSFIRICKAIFVTIFVVHCAACFYYILATTYHDPTKTWIALSMKNFETENVWHMYVVSMYWSMSTLTKVGYGDIHPVNTREKIFVIFYMIISVGLFIYWVAIMTSLISHRISVNMNFRNKLQAASKFAKRNRLPVCLQAQIISHLCLKYRVDSEGLQKQEVLESFPKAIKSSISHFLFYSLLDKVYLFRGISNDVFCQLVSEVKVEYFPPNEDVILQDEAPTDLYVVVAGAMKLIVRRQGVEEVVKELKSGDVCGELGVVCYRSQPFTVRTKRLCQLLRLNRTVLMNLVQENAGDGQIIMNNLLEHLNIQDHPVMQSLVIDIERMLAQSQIDWPLGLLFATARGNKRLLQLLLERGFNPNERDTEDRIALHIAVANGNENCVAILLAFGADPNIKDSKGNVPLWYAIMEKHPESLIKLLLDHGATLASCDAPQYAFFAIEQNNLMLLHDIVRYGGNVTLPVSNGTTPLHAAVSRGNPAIVRFLLEQGADIDKDDEIGLTPRILVDLSGNEEIKALFDVTPIPSAHEMSNVHKHPRDRGNVLHNGLLGVLSTSARGETSALVDKSVRTGKQPARITLRCPEKSEVVKLVMLPDTIEELLEIGSKKFGCYCTKLLSIQGADIDKIDFIRAGDQVSLVCDNKSNVIQRQ